MLQFIKYKLFSILRRVRTRSIKAGSCGQEYRGHRGWLRAPVKSPDQRLAVLVFPSPPVSPWRYLRSCLQRTQTASRKATCLRSEFKTRKLSNRFWRRDVVTRQHYQQLERLPDTDPTSLLISLESSSSQLSVSHSVL